MQIADFMQVAPSRLKLKEGVKKISLKSSEDIKNSQKSTASDKAFRFIASCWILFSEIKRKMRAARIGGNIDFLPDSVLEDIDVRDYAHNTAA